MSKKYWHKVVKLKKKLKYNDIQVSKTVFCKPKIDDDHIKFIRDFISNLEKEKKILPQFKIINREVFVSEFHDTCMKGVE